MISDLGNVIVAAIQFKPELLNVNRNIEQSLQYVFEAATKGAKIIVLPELCTSGYAFENFREAANCAQEKDGYQTRQFETLAQDLSCYVVFGYPETCNGMLYNSAMVVGPRGHLENIQKHNLWATDNLWAQPSEKPFPVIQTPYGRLGVLICRDAKNKYRDSYRFAKSEQKFYSRGSIDHIALVSAWGSNKSYPDTSWVDLCEETGANIIVSNRYGNERHLSFGGGICVIDRNRKIWNHGSKFDADCIVGGMATL